MNFNISTSNRFDNLPSDENTQNDGKIDDVIEIDVAKARQIPLSLQKVFTKYSKEET